MVNNSFIFGMKQEKSFIALLLTVVILGLVMMHTAWQGSRLVGQWEFVSREFTRTVVGVPVVDSNIWEFNSDGTLYIESFSGWTWHWNIHGPWLRITLPDQPWLATDVPRYRIVDDRLILTDGLSITEYRRID